MAVITRDDAAIDILSSSAEDLQKMMESGRLTTADLVEMCLHQIETYDRRGRNLRAIIRIAPRDRLLKRAAFLDQERHAGRVAGPLHGIPIVLKDIVNTAPSLGLGPTTGASFAFSDSQNARSALLEDKLFEAGIIMLGRTNMSELGGFKGPSPLAGLSAVGGQTQSAYIPGGVVEDDDYMNDSLPSGSSSGSAVAVSAGYSPIAIGAEADGSIQNPASRAALFALKVTPKTLSTDGLFFVAPTFEALGGMTKAVKDLHDITTVIMSTAEKPRTLNVSRQKTWKDFTLGFLDHSIWGFTHNAGAHTTAEYKKQISDSTHNVMNEIEKLGGTVHYPIHVRHSNDITIGDLPGYVSILNGEIRETMNAYLKNLESSPIRSLDEMLKFNEEHPQLQAGIKQDWFVPAQEDTRNAEEVEEVRRAVKKAAGEENIFKVMDEFSLDFVCVCTDGEISAIAALAGCPTANVPLGYRPNGRPFGLTFVARPGGEDKLLEVMYTYEATFSKRRPPPLGKL